MDVLRYKHASSSQVKISGSTLTLSISPLTQYQIEQAELNARSHFEAHGCLPVGHEFNSEVGLQIIALASPLDADALRACLFGDELEYLYDQWILIQEQSTPDIGQLKEHLRKAVNNDPSITIDGLMAYQSEDAQAYYGKPMIDLTVGQLAYYLCLWSAYKEFHVPDESGKTKMVSKKWLNKKS